MKKLVLTIAIVLGLGMTTFAENGGLFQRGEAPAGIYGDRTEGLMMPGLPSHGSDNNEPAAPLGSGVVALLGLGAAYLVSKKRKEE